MPEASQASSSKEEGAKEYTWHERKYERKHGSPLQNPKQGLAFQGTVPSAEACTYGKLLAQRRNKSQRGVH